jgi:glyoxylase-like metal-dependent hydrolase (beta-lactamase superfamily II)
MPIRNRYQFANVEGARVGRFNMGINTTFIVYRIGDTLIDSGPSNQWRAVKSFIDEHRVTQLLLSHHHEDHSGNAVRIAKHCQLAPFAPELARKKLANGYPTPLLQKLIWGSPVPVNTDLLPNSLQLSDGSKLLPIHTPGHSKDLHCFYLPENGWLFSGDLYISKSLRYMRSDENLSQLIESIRKVLTLEFDVIFCPHRGILEKGKHALAEKLDNVLTLCANAQRLHQQGYEVGYIVKKLLGAEGALSRLTNFNFSKTNLVTQALKVKVPVTDIENDGLKP